MKIFVLDQFYKDGVDLVKKHAEVIEPDDPRVHSWPEEADGVMVRMTPIRGEDIARSKHLKVIAKQGVGVDTIDLDAAREKGIVVCRTLGTNSESVAEMAMALALSVTRRTAELDREIRSGRTVRRADFLGHGFWGKTVGILGMGNIGTRCARKWRQAFDMNVLAYDPYAPADAWADIEHERVETPDAMFPRIDLLCVHVPLTEETRGMVGERALSMMKPNAIVVSVARGGVVDESALYDAIRGGRIFGAGLDVWESEPPTADHPLLSLPTVVATPHAAGGTIETQRNSALMAAQQVLDVLDGKEAICPVV